MSNNVFTAPKAFITIDNKPAGYIRGLSFSENIQRADIKGLGDLNSKEVPAVSMSQTFNIDQFFISFKHPATKSLLNRLGGAAALRNSLSLGEFSFSIVVYKKTVVASDPAAKLVTEIDKEGETIIKLIDCFTDSQSFNLSEAGVSGLNTSGRYLTPITFNP